MNAAGIDIGGTNIRAVLTDESGTLLGFRKISTPRTSREIVDAIGGLVAGFASRAAGGCAVSVLGVGCAGALDRGRGSIITSPNIPALAGFPIARALEKKLGIRVFIENDATAAVAGEQWKGNGGRFSNWLMITLGTGIGGGAVINGGIYTGRSGAALEIGHMSIDHGGRRCPCGNTGCLERYASATALVHDTRRRLGNFPGSSLRTRIKGTVLTAQMIYEEARSGDELALQSINELSRWLGIGITNLVNIFNPEAVIFGGGLSKAGRFILPVVRNTVEERALKGLRKGVRFLVTKNEEKTPSLGAAKIALDHSIKGA
jgi:glucokinase